ncbi:hypothetical protein HPB50_003708 [Hyalomma asiaticum]|uniref:Uncharacterized protein n=1 Tax=Hyalomma asiaticum TaxID=266040 RepID=A0ACB7SYJ8_HYAAI|nr:hypothetical protein HPB50_003708 [Hyalomma asiaticum]
MQRTTLPRAAIVAAFGSCLVFHCLAAPANGQPNNLVDGGAPGPADVVAEGVAKASNDFGLALYRAYANASATGNLFFSPWSLSRVLAMVLLGARNETAAELSRALAVDRFEDPAAAFAAQRELARHLLTSSSELASTSIALTRAGDPVSPEYRANLDQYLDDGGVMEVDFSRSEDLLSKVNGEVSRLTGGRIKDALRRSPDPLSKLLLLNAVHFRGVWEKAFNPNDSFDGIFRGATRNTPVRMMSGKGKFPLAYEGNAYVLELPYTGESSLVIALPRRRTQKDLSDIESRLEDILVSARPELRSIEVELPKLTVRSSLDLKEPLKKLGVNALFSEHHADLSGMQAEGGLYVEDVHHGAALELDEKGTVASASTVAIIVSRIGTPRFSADRPFVFAIKHRPTGLLLFVGRVTDL